MPGLTLTGGKSGTKSMNVFENQRCESIHIREHKLQRSCINLISAVVPFSWLWVGWSHGAERMRMRMGMRRR